MENKVKKPIYKKWWFWLIVVVVLFVVICAFVPVEDEQNTANNTVETTVEESTKIVESDLDIVLRSNHPKYYGSIDEAQKVWDDVKDKVSYSNNYSKNSDDVIITISDYKNDENKIIRSLGIDFENMDGTDKVDLEKALDIADSYFPYDVVKDWYEFNYSKCISSKAGEESDTYYVISYNLTDKGKEEYNDTHTYAGTIDFIIHMDNNNENVSSLSIGFGTPKWMGFLDKNGYEEKEWNYDFLVNAKG